jgi:hypothetical protein
MIGAGLADLWRKGFDLGLATQVDKMPSNLIQYALCEIFTGCFCSALVLLPCCLLVARLEAM